MTKPSSENERIAGKLREAADILQAQRANPFRVRANRRAADRVALHTERNDWRVTVLSNTAQAHQLERTRDWVVVSFHTDARPEGQRTVVTETKGPLAGRRVVRGREPECQAHYASQGETRRREERKIG